MVHDLPHGSPQASGVTEFLSHSTSSQPTPVSRLFSPSTVQDSLVKGEQVPLHGGSTQVPATGSSKYFPEWGALGFMEEISSLLLMGRPFTGSIIEPGLQNLQSAQAGEMLTGHQSSVAIPAEQAQGRQLCHEPKWVTVVLWYIPRGSKSGRTFNLTFSEWVRERVRKYPCRI